MIRERLGTRDEKGGLAQGFRGRVDLEGIGLAADLRPVAQGDGSLNRVTPEHEVIVAYGADPKQRLDLRDRCGAGLAIDGRPSNHAEPGRRPGDGGLALLDVGVDGSREATCEGRQLGTAVP